MNVGEGSPDAVVGDSLGILNKVRMQAHFELSCQLLTIDEVHISVQSSDSYGFYNAFISSLSRSIAGGRTSPIPSQNLRCASRSNGVSP